MVTDIEGSPVPVVSAVGGSEGDRLGAIVVVGDGDAWADEVGAVGPCDVMPGWSLVVARACAVCCGSAAGACWAA